MSAIPFMNNNKNFTNVPSQSDTNLGNKSQANPILNGINSQLKNDSNNVIFNKKIENNPFKIKNEPSSNNLNAQINQNENNKNNYNSFRLLNTQPNDNIKSSNNINFSQNNKNNILLNNNSINNNNNNNLSQNPSNIFNNDKGANNPFNIIANNSKPSNNNIPPTINSNQIKKEEKKEETNIFLSQSNNILDKSNIINDSQSQNIPQLNKLPSQIPNFENKPGNVSILIPEKKENPKVNDFLNNLLAEDKIMFSEEEKREFEKRQLSYKLNGEIIDEFKYMLETQKEKYHKLTNNERIFESKFINLVNNIKNIAYGSLDSEIKSEKLSDKIRSIEAKFSKLKSNMIKKDAAMTKGLDYLKKNINNNINNFSSLKNDDFEKNNPIYKDLIETSENVRKIDNDIKQSWNSIIKNNENENEINEIYCKENNINNFNNDRDGIFIERKNMDNNTINRIYVQQKDINNLFTECYFGLYSLKCSQDKIENNYNILKNKLINKIKENNNNLGNRNIQNEDLNL